MYRYLYEETCFDLNFEAKKPLDSSIQLKVKEVLAKNLGITEDDVRLVFYKVSNGTTEAELEARIDVDKNFNFVAQVVVTSYGTTIVSLTTRICRIDPVYLRDALNIKTEELVANIAKEFMKNSFYQDIFADYKKKYEGVSRKIYESLEIAFGID